MVIATIGAKSPRLSVPGNFPYPQALNRTPNRPREDIPGPATDDIESCFRDEANRFSAVDLPRAAALDSLAADPTPTQRPCRRRVNDELGPRTYQGPRRRQNGCGVQLKRCVPQRRLADRPLDLSVVDLESPLGETPMNEGPRLQRIAARLPELARGQDVSRGRRPNDRAAQARAACGPF